MPDDSEKPTRLGSRHRPRASELSKETTEGDLWDLDEDPVPPPPPPEHNPIPPRAPSQNGPVSKSVGEDNRSQAQRPDPGIRRNIARFPGLEPLAEVPDSPAEAPAESTPEPLPQTVAEPLPEPPATAEVPETGPQAGTEPDIPSSGAEQSATAPGQRDLLNSLIAAAALLILALCGVFLLFSKLSTTRYSDENPGFPQEGSLVTIASVTSYWRKPIREGPDADVARAGAEYLPVVHVALEKSNSGALRVFFRNDQGELIGDPITRAFTDGKFRLSDSNEIDLAATDGFTGIWEYNAYRVDRGRWTAEILEGPSVNAPGNAFETLVTVPISTTRR